MTKPNEPVHPTDIYYDEHRYGQEDGLTKREYFAICALQGLLSTEMEFDNWSDPATELSTLAVLYADTLIAKLNEVKND